MTIEIANYYSWAFKLRKHIVVKFAGWWLVDVDNIQIIDFDADTELIDWW